MARLFPLFLAVILLVGTVGLLPGGLAQTTTESTPSEPESAPVGNNASVAPGEQLAGVVGVGKTEVAGEVAARAFGFAVSSAKTNGTKALLVSRQLSDLNTELNSLHQRKQDLRQARSNGSISEGRFRAEMAQLVAQIRTTNRLTNETQVASSGIPRAHLNRHGVSDSAIDRLRRNASQLTGPQAAAMARSIAGPRAGAPLGHDLPNAVTRRSGAPGPPAQNSTAPGRSNASPSGPNDTSRRDGSQNPDEPERGDNNSSNRSEQAANQTKNPKQGDPGR